MRIWLLPLLAGALHAATVRGTVIDNLSGHALAHASVLLEPVSGSAGKRMTGHTNRYGLFEFPDTLPGVYFLQATRIPFLTAYYGQKRWNSSGMPLTISDAETPFVTIRMLRYAAISGTVVDENDVGQPQFEVGAYRRDVLPLQPVAKGSADERGNFRIYGLLPGDYLVRSLGKELEGTGFKPTFAHETESVDNAHILNVDMEEEAHELKLRPLPGKLFSLTVSVDTLEPIDAPVTITVASEMGRQTFNGARHTFTGLPRGDYDVIAEAPSDVKSVTQGAYQRISIAQDMSTELTCRKADPYFQFNGLPTQGQQDGSLKVVGRRKDLAGPHGTDVIQITDSRAPLAVGPWDFAVVPIDGRYVSNFSGSGSYRPRKHFEGWNEAIILPRPNSASVRFYFSSGTASLHGTVTDTGDPAIGAPVFIEPVDLEPERRITPCYVTSTDVHGRFQFSGLAPGRYRVLSSFEYQMPDSKIMVGAGARDLQIDARTDVAVDLTLYVIR
jgi:hypothetical protein